MVNSFLGLNPQIADAIAGVIYTAPMFGMPAPPNFVTKFAIKMHSLLFDEIILSDNIKTE